MLLLLLLLLRASMTMRLVGAVLFGIWRIETVVRPSGCMVLATIVDRGEEVVVLRVAMDTVVVNRVP